LRDGAPVPEILSTDQLLTLYKVAIEEYRFEVRLNWDRTAFHLTLNSGLIAIATGLLKIGTAPIVNLSVAVVFFVGLCVSLIGYQGNQEGSSVLSAHHFKKDSVRRSTRPKRATGTV
jgi:hypothetical protein